MENSKSLSRAGWIGLVVLFLGLVTLGVVFLIYRSRAKKSGQQSNSNPVVERKEKPSNSEQKETFAQISEYAMECGAPQSLADTLAAVSAHETGRWNSQLAKEHYNLFGMKTGGSGQGIQSGEASGYAVYDSWEDSIRDVVEWFKAKGYPMDDDTMSTENILQWMKSKRYFEDTLANYRKAVLSLKNELND